MDVEFTMVNLALFGLLSLWILVGVLLHILVGRNPTRKQPPLARGVSRRLCVEGDMLTVRLTCRAEGLPVVHADTVCTPWDIVLVIDHSGSMGSGPGSALDEARKAAITLISTTPKEFRFAVVVFDHDASEVCPITDRRRGLIRAVNGIHSGGSTDIARGLEVAGQALPVFGVEDNRRHAVILLSDGGSDGEPAIVMSNRLKEDPDLLLIAVGIGAADMPLLRQLASTPDHCYHVEQIDELTALYGQIGEMMTGTEASEVTLTEYLPRTGAFGLREWSELPPAEFRLMDFTACWLFPALQPKSPISVEYCVEAVCPGWQRVAPQAARLNARLADDSHYESLSNHGPRVLVLPRIPGWQVLWLLLNPLFFLLFGRWFCRERLVPVAAPVVPPQPQSFIAPPQMEPAPLTREPPLSARPTLMLGIGYAGIHALTHCKRLAWERTGRVDFDRLRFLAVDMANEDFFPSPCLGRVALSAEERMTMDRPLEPVIAVAAAAGFSDRYPWLDASALAAGGARPDLHRGTGGQRTLGRLAAVENRDALTARLRPLLEVLIAQAGDGGIDLLISAGSGGGTGAGALLDVCWLLRMLLNELNYTDSSTTVFLTAPATSVTMPADPAQQALQQSNHAALLAELDRLSVLRAESLAPAPELAALPRWVDRVFQVAPAQQIAWPPETVLYPKAGEAMFTWFASDQRGGLRDYFLAQDAANNQAGREIGRCLLHRIDPVSHYLFPHTLQRYMATDTLRRTLAARFWNVEETNFVRYGVGMPPSADAATLLQRWLDARNGTVDHPWVLVSLGAFENSNVLQQTLYRGGGPEISAGVSTLARRELLREQRLLIRQTLDTWVQDAMNHGVAGVCAPHALAFCIHALRELARRLRDDASPVAAHLVSTSALSRVRGEIETVAELVSQALCEVDTLLRRLDDWDTRLGEGSAGRGLMRILDERCGELRAEITRLRDATNEGRSPRLPLTEEQLSALPALFLPNLDEHLSQRMQWTLTRADNQLQLALVLHGSDVRTWIPEFMGRDDTGTVALADALVDMTSLLAVNFSNWCLNDYPVETLPLLHATPPRTEMLNTGAHGRYLRQGEGHFDVRAHIDQLSLVPIDRREARIISIEENLASSLLISLADVGSQMPFVFAEEQNAYRGYQTFCRAERRLFDTLPASLVGLCGDPDALLSFALVGLGEGRIALRDDGLRSLWYASTDDGTEFVLADAGQTDLETLVRVAAAWIDQADASQLQVSAVRGLSAVDLAQRLGGHPLAMPVAEHPWFKFFVAVVWGLLQWR